MFMFRAFFTFVAVTFAQISTGRTSGGAGGRRWSEKKTQWERETARSLSAAVRGARLGCATVPRPPQRPLTVTLTTKIHLCTLHCSAHFCNAVQASVRVGLNLRSFGRAIPPQAEFRATGQLLRLPGDPVQCFPDPVTDQTRQP